MNKSILTPIVVGVLASAVITGCSGSKDKKSDSGGKTICEYNIQGGNSVDVMFGTAYSKPNVKVTKEGKEVTFEQTGTVNTNKIGTYTVSYTGKSCENSQVRTIKVVPSACEYRVKGKNPLTVSFGSTFVDPGFDVKNINKKAVEGVTTGAVDTTIAGNYILTYKGKNCNNSTTRKVEVVAGTCSYTLKGDSPLTLNLGDTYSDPGVTVKDSQQKIVTSTVTGTADTSKIGDYTVTYKGVGCSNEKTRKVIVKVMASSCSYDLNGDNPLEVTVGDAYQELGVLIKDASQHTVTGTTSGTVDNKKIGDYSITYQSENCTNTKIRTVKVVAANCTYTLSGSDPLLIDKGDTFTDPGVVVKDNNNAVVTSTISGEVDTTKVGDYTRTYQGQNCANSQTRTVKVAMQTCAYKLFGDSPLEFIVNNAYADPGAEIKDKSGAVLVAKAMGKSTVAVDKTKAGQYVLSYTHTACGNSADRIVKVRELTNSELKETILPTN
jgi:hypothetical protein